MGGGCLNIVPEGGALVNDMTKGRPPRWVYISRTIYCTIRQSGAGALVDEMTVESQHGKQHDMTVTRQQPA